MYVHPKKITKGVKERNRKRKERKKMKTKTKKNETQTKHALRAQAESQGDKVAACWYDQSYDMSSRWINRRTRGKEQTEDKTRKGQS